MRQVLLDAAPPQPWRNGGGVTRELLAWPDAADWRVRVSVADIAADGPFSVFAGVERWFCVLRGSGVVLTIDGAPQQVRVGDAALRFDGDASTDCRLVAGPTRDLNLMLRGVRGALLAVDDGQPWSPSAAMCGLFAAVPGRCGSTALPAGTLLWFDTAPATLSFHADPPTATPAGWWITATPEETFA